MRNVTHLGMCWMMTLGLVAVAIGQQLPAPTGGQTTPASVDTIAPASQPPQAQPNSTNQKNSSSNQLTMPAPDRSLLVNSPPEGQQASNSEQRRGELGVWMGETGGPGVRILRVTNGGAAEQAGLRVGDVILQVNGRGASSPHDTATMIRQIAVGQTGNITIWREGNQQHLQITMQPAREAPRQIVENTQREVALGRYDSPDSDLASRTVKLELQINSLTQELATLRKELAQLRSVHPIQAGFNAESNQSATPPASQSRYTPPGVGTSEEKPSKPADATKLAPLPTPPTDVKSPSNDPFKSDSTPATSGEKLKAEEKPAADNKDNTDDLFK